MASRARPHSPRKPVVLERPSAVPPLGPSKGFEVHPNSPPDEPPASARGKSAQPQQPMSARGRYGDRASGITPRRTCGAMSERSSPTTPRRHERPGDGSTTPRATGTAVPPSATGSSSARGVPRSTPLTASRAEAARLGSESARLGRFESGEIDTIDVLYKPVGAMPGGLSANPTPRGYASATKSAMRATEVKGTGSLVRPPKTREAWLATPVVRLPKASVSGMLKTALERLDPAYSSGLAATALSGLSADAEGMVGSDQLTRCWLKYVLPSLERVPPAAGGLPAATLKLRGSLCAMLGDRLPNIMLQQVARGVGWTREG